MKKYALRILALICVLAITLPAFAINFGPGLSTVKSELNDNERESKAVYLIQEEGKRNPTLVKFTQKDSPVTGKDWIWAGVENRYFLRISETLVASPATD